MEELNVQEEVKPEPNPQPVEREQQITMQEEVSLQPDGVLQPDPLQQPPNEAHVTSEVIKAPKVELSGLKVLGKIDLPDLKKKSSEDAAETEVSEEPAKTSAEKKRGSPRRDMRSQRPSQNPIAFEREKEALEAKKKVEAEAERQKERRTQNYLKKVKTGQPTKAVKIIQEETEQMSASELAEPPKTLWDKLVRWFTT
jgi:hypothetical protein